MHILRQGVIQVTRVALELMGLTSMVLLKDSHLVGKVLEKCFVTPQGLSVKLESDDF